MSPYLTGQRNVVLPTDNSKIIWPCILVGLSPGSTTTLHLLSLEAPPVTVTPRLLGRESSRTSPQNGKAFTKGTDSHSFGLN